MAKTNWVLNEIVMPADMNQIGTEINAKAEINDTIQTGTETLGLRWCRRSLGVNFSLANSPNQKIRISLPSLNFGGNIKLTVLGSYNVLNLNGIMEKSFTGNLIGSNQTFDGNSNYEKVYSTIQTANGFLNACQISDLKSDSNGFFFEFCVSVSTASHVFSFFLEAKSSSGANLSDLIKGASLGNFYADTVVLPKAIVQERQLQLTAPQGTPPLIVASTTRVDNLNPEFWSGWRIFNSLTQLGIPETSTIQETINAMPVNSVLYLNINASYASNFQLTGYGVGLLNITKFSSSRATSTFNDVNGNFLIGLFNTTLSFIRWNIISKEGGSVSFGQITSTVSQGQSPFVINSTTKVDNLNSDSVNGFKFFNSFAQIGVSNTPTMQQVINAMPDLSYLKVGVNVSSNTGLGLPSNAEGTLEVSKIYTSRVFSEFNEFNGDKYTARINSSSNFSGWNKLLKEGTAISITQLTSTASQGTAPLVVASNTKVDNLNSDLLDGMHADVNKTASTIVSRKSDGGINIGGFSSLEQIGIRLPGRNRELRMTQGSDNISYIQLVNDSGGFIANPIQFNPDGTTGLNSSININAYSNPSTPQIRNTHVGNNAPSNSLGINGDIYIEL